ncbi:MAG: Ubiquinone/menaquinone biosynthesis C-methyltransferase UbiE [Anaerolineae bacterium]|nr:Ubiquinone/menaquinone biosynthesis C-methyltransferase UbiE [Anaerolineae bacterium]
MPRAWVRFAFDQFYNRFAFTYDAVSAAVSRGEWRAWTRAALPFVHGARVLEIAFGTGNLHLDLYAAGYTPVGIDLSPYMLALTQKKLRARHLTPRLARADVCALPFPSDFFSTLVMTFPPGFIFNPAARREMHRVLEPRGRLVWVDAAELDAENVWGRFINRAFQITGTGAAPAARAQLLQTTFDATRWSWRVEMARARTSRVQVTIAEKK